jgi:hypothetical protein
MTHHFLVVHPNGGTLEARQALPNGGMGKK